MGQGPWGLTAGQPPGPQLKQLPGLMAEAKGPQGGGEGPRPAPGWGRGGHPGCSRQALKTPEPKKKRDGEEKGQRVWGKGPGLQHRGWIEREGRGGRGKADVTRLPSAERCGVRQQGEGSAQAPPGANGSRPGPGGWIYQCATMRCACVHVCMHACKSRACLCICMRINE